MHHPVVLVGRSNLLLFIPEAVRTAVEHLELLGAVERKEGQVLLTALGKKMASFPLEPRYAKVKSARGCIALCTACAAGF